ncbi:MAG: hypothetical protein AB7Y46_04130 [Armatimonadota bacterium]
MRDAGREAGGRREGMRRREFVGKLLAAGIGLPAGISALLAGCEGGLLENDQGGGGAAPGDLSDKVAQMRALQTQVIDAIRTLQDASNADVSGWLAQINAQTAVVWPLMVAADQQALRDNVAADMAAVLGHLDQLGVPIHFQGPVPTITQQAFHDAWERAHQVGSVSPTGLETAADGPAPHVVWAYLFMLFVLFPTLSDSLALSYATDAASRDTNERALALWSLFHPSGPIGCTPCLFSQLISSVAGVTTFLYLGMASHAAGAPGLLFGRDRLVMTMLIAALLLVDFA